MVRRRLSLPFTDVKEDDEVVADEEINKRKWKSYHEIIYIYIYIYNFHSLLLFENLMNDATSHLTSLLCKSSVSKYMIMT